MAMNAAVNPAVSALTYGYEALTGYGMQSYNSGESLSGWERAGSGAIATVSAAATVAAGFGGASALSSGTASGIANPVPSTMARVISGEGPFPTLGMLGSADVFVTDASAIRGLTPTQISQRLGIPTSDAFTVFEFPTPPQGFATPVFRSNTGFVGGGLTSGRAPEFVIPNGPIPPGASSTIIRSR